MLVLGLVGRMAASDVNSLTEDEAREGWRLLFDGSSLDGWRGFKSERPDKNWRVEDGALVLRGKAGDLVTQEAFGDFELTLEWKVAEGANSGVIYRVGLGEANTFTTGPEYQVLDNVKAHDNHPASHRAGALYDLEGIEEDVTRPVGEWNQARIVVSGWRVQHWLNGRQIVDVDLASPAGKALIAASKFKHWEKFASLARGHLALQDHGDVVSYRAIKLRELK
ncbi:protein of unknown function DUF1080 [Opitutus terrae PB90-1]|uniref:3-keto-alpha-glucoside-1,2-lyase/3-keto-2-hydroxy-glucal hydratase domain-containing protein n=2 Tax=Opitutus terrae TaxID=107709 RepID=B1ZW91_OPITP|nr:protein of unknown function DUF1080 [Opitutus terrae PB90-1]